MTDRLSGSGRLPGSGRVLVTGGVGFIGSRVVRALRGEGAEVVVLDLKAPGEPLDGVRYLRGDVRDPAACEAALRGVDAVSHQAAKVGLGVDLQDLPDYADHNDRGTAVLLAAMDRARVRRLVLASSMVVYGEGAYACSGHGEVKPASRKLEDLQAGRFEPTCPECGAPLEPGLVGEEAVLDPRNAYAASKVAQEHLAAAWTIGGGGSVAALRYHNVYGPGLPRDTPYAGVAAIFLSSLASGEPPQVYEDGRQRRDFVHVDDVARANVAALRGVADIEGLRAFNVGSGTPRTVGDMARELSRAMHGPAPEVTGQFRLGDVRHVTASSRRARSELDWRPEVEFAAGMRALANAATSESRAGAR